MGEFHTIYYTTASTSLVQLRFSNAADWIALDAAPHMKDAGIKLGENDQNLKL